jgi:hypothetical protein
MVGVLAERLPHLLDREVHSLFEVYEGVACPEREPDFFAGDDAPRLTREEAKQPKRLRLQPDAAAVLEEPFGLEVELERTEAKKPGV